MKQCILHHCIKKGEAIWLQWIWSFRTFFYIDHWTVSYASPSSKFLFESLVRRFCEEKPNRSRAWSPNLASQTTQRTTCVGILLDFIFLRTSILWKFLRIARPARRFLIPPTLVNSNQNNGAMLGSEAEDQPWALQPLLGNPCWLLEIFKQIPK